MDRALKLGFDGFNAASSANIPEQSEPGEAAGLMVVNGKVDQGSSANKGMRLEVSLADYSDGLIEGVYDVVYDGGPNGIFRRKAGTIHVVGTATSDYGVFNVDVSL
ncbi:hypothetical protein [Nannocystis punicea]|uniref:Uncharacterized protein n=1 Tax=Nannocystis punicea TaxID=2995304 RepID=A0ABY7GXW1_9BACT|nr:hypothetical protein [Nannocystis poenicansa]WAS91814.1 hypothetical protein O0S08_36995 [Nannocystis poenicansa]